MINIIIIIVLLIISALFSGLTLGLMSLDTYELKREKKLNNKYAKKIYPLRKKSNMLLCTLIIGNVAVNTALSIFMGGIMNGVVAGIIVTALIVIFGEILPQAIFSKHALKWGSKFVGFVWVVYYLFFILSYPIAYFLDKLLGKEMPRIYNKQQIKLLVEENLNLDKSDISKLNFSLISKTLEFDNKIVKDIMTPRVNAHFIEYKEPLNKNTLSEIKKIGHSRIPVYKKDKDNVLGLLYAKDLIPLDPDNKILVYKQMRKKVIYVNEDERLPVVLQKFNKTKKHLFIVKNKFNGVAGVITLEDVIEEIFGEIIDEYDKVIDIKNHKKPIKKTPKKISEKNSKSNIVKKKSIRRKTKKKR